jgi:hypothetical protein
MKNIMHMKGKIRMLTICLFLLGYIPVSAQQESSDKIKVWGNCGMCKKTIEKAALQAGAASANWNKDTKMLTVSYLSKNSSKEKIQKSIAATGYDTQDFTASGEAYRNLPECCQYERKQVSTPGSGAPQTNQSCCNNTTCTMEKDGSKRHACCSGKDGSRQGDHGSACCKGVQGEQAKDCCKDMTSCKEKGCCKA